MVKFIKKYWLLIISFIYLIWPIDIISDIFGPLGLIDDGFLLLVAILNAMRKRKDEVKVKV